MTSLSPGSGTNTEVIDTPSTTFTWAAGYSAAIVAGLSAVLTVLQGLNVLDITEPVRIACIGLIGAGVLAWAIAAAGDSLARAYALAHVTRTDEGKPNQPAILTAASKLAEGYAAAHGVKLAPTKCSTPTAAPSTAATATQATAQTYYLALPTPLKVKVGAKDGEAIAIKVSSEGGKETQQYLVATSDSTFRWEVEQAVAQRRN